MTNPTSMSEAKTCEVCGGLDCSRLGGDYCGTCYALGYTREKARADGLAAQLRAETAAWLKREQDMAALTQACADSAEKRLREVEEALRAARKKYASHGVKDAFRVLAHAIDDALVQGPSGAPPAGEGVPVGCGALIDRDTFELTQDGGARCSTPEEHQHHAQPPAAAPVQERDASSGWIRTAPDRWAAPLAAPLPSAKPPNPKEIPPFKPLHGKVYFEPQEPDASTAAAIAPAGPAPAGSANTEASAKPPKESAHKAEGVEEPAESAAPAGRCEGFYLVVGELEPYYKPCGNTLPCPAHPATPAHPGGGK